MSHASPDMFDRSGLSLPQMFYYNVLRSFIRSLDRTQPYFATSKMGSNGTATNALPPGNPPVAPVAPGGTLNPSVSATLNPFAPHIAPIKEISISSAMINSLANDPKFNLLDMSLDNYSVWERSMKAVLELNNLFKYALGLIPEPAYVITPNTENTL
ncbi:hypothetical protein FIBSPDRAFT_884265 [Athelia psychrophila]|uniref:Uncharacterized protein n=1 Tax=Athelia psychrophila TaxID=1759441 RepID=A0A166T8W8_9AGAM|nr:hypothetical protein FIBSPDRAFT_884265 [Fibularhizoctonia sp. CBS 109695]